MEVKLVRKKKRLLIVFVSLIMLIVLSIGVPVLMYNSYLKSPVSSENKEIEVEVEKGANSTTIIDELSKSGLITNKLFAKIYVRRLNIDKSLKVGIYKFSTSMTPTDIFAKLKKGAPDVDLAKVTIPEGFTVKQIAEKMQQSGVIGSSEEFIKEAQENKLSYHQIGEVTGKDTKLLRERDMAIDLANYDLKARDYPDPKEYLRDVIHFLHRR
jgi:UPF0755 protein